MMSIGLWFAMLFPIHYTDPKLKPYTDVYNRITSEYCGWDDYIEPRQTIVMFSDLEKPKIGVCINYGFGWVIQIDKTFWDNASVEDKFHLVAHESGHCRLGIMHNPNDWSSYMYPSIEKIPMRLVALQVLADAKMKCSKSSKE